MQSRGEQVLNLGHVIAHRQHIGNDEQGRCQQDDQEHPEFDYEPHKPAPCKRLASGPRNAGGLFDMGRFCDRSLMGSPLCIGPGHVNRRLPGFNPTFGLGIGLGDRISQFLVFCFCSGALLFLADFLFFVVLVLGRFNYIFCNPVRFGLLRRTWFFLRLT